MPTLPPEPDDPNTFIERSRAVVQAVTGGVSARLMVLMAVAVVGASLAPVPWSQLGLVALLGVALDVARSRRNP